MIISKFKTLAVTAALVAGSAALTQPAHAGGRVSIGIGVGGYYPAPAYQPYYYSPPVVYTPAPTYYYAPAPTYSYTPPAVVYQAPPVYYSAPVYAAPVYSSPFALSFGFGFGRSWGHGWGGHHWR